MSEKSGSRKRRILKNVLASVLVLGLVGGGVAYTVVTVDRADRTAPTVAWEKPAAKATAEDPAAGIHRGRASTPMSKLLLPVPEGYVLGADLQGYGNDDEVPAERAAALLKQTGKGFYGKKRRAYEKEVDRLGIQGMAMRTYADENSSLQAEVLILRMKDKKTVREFFAFRKEMAEYLELRKGPKIKEYATNSACYLGPKPVEPEQRDDEERTPALQDMTCWAYDGEVMVTVRAFGAAPFDQKAVAGLVEKQLRHIESPGEYV
ncbi:hypothetical protein ABZY16_07125 [Streptomyces sp. NPDC006553]|uniref:hypothetical protein n=1 Tax=unclassified Streptomyces TaxID=2593676 RepID=UPI00225C3A59|nr:hypothetical protein [Streptomyces sp. NBC_00233]MCX5227649.1 hypothetical protein [Streptomyces sp. NBC_00233]